MWSRTPDPPQLSYEQCPRRARYNSLIRTPEAASLCAHPLSSTQLTPRTWSVMLQTNCGPRPHLQTQVRGRQTSGASFHTGRTQLSACRNPHATSHAPIRRTPPANPPRTILSSLARSTAAAFWPQPVTSPGPQCWPPFKRRGAFTRSYTTPE